MPEPRERDGRLTPRDHGASLPSGLVTFVITDIEGSTRLFRRLGPAYLPLLETHNALLRKQWGRHGGAEVKTVGDSFVVAFASAAEALAAAVAAQENITSYPWPEGATIKVRIGVHTGMAFPHEGDYIALALHQASRVVGAANGGFVLASDDAVDAAGDELSVSVEPVGTYRLRDFDQPVALSAAAPLDEPLPKPVPVRAVPAQGHNLIAPATTFVGRDDAIAEVSRRLASGRLLTIVGPGGMGKTRLAVELGLRVAADGGMACGSPTSRRQPTVASSQRRWQMHSACREANETTARWCSTTSCRGRRC